MMLQGHFIDGLLDTSYRDSSHLGYAIWQYFRGITAPVFFTVSGFIFTYLLVRAPQRGWNNPRVAKGIKRGLQLLIIGYLLRMNLFGLLTGNVYDSFYLVDVLHCIGLSILGILGIYVLTVNLGKWVFPGVLVATTFILFLFEPRYEAFSFSFLPDVLANYFTKANGSVFTIFPWLGYATFGGFLALLFTRFQHFLGIYPVAILTSLCVGGLLIFFSSDLFFWLGEILEIPLFLKVYFNNYLFIRLGDVFVVFALFMLFRKWLTHPTVLKLGQSTLSIYVIHFILLYGSFTGLGLYGFLHHSLMPWMAISGAIAFMVLCAFGALWYEANKMLIRQNLSSTLGFIKTQTAAGALVLNRGLRTLLGRLIRLFGLAKNG